MKTWMNYTDTERKQMLERTSASIAEHFAMAIVEKDWWVTTVIKALYSTSVASYLSFKGGTSLSKAWNVVERFSEDIDLALDHSYFEIDGTNKSLREKLRKTSRKYLTGDFCIELDEQLRLLGARDFEVKPITIRMKNGVAQPLDSDKDPVAIHVQYRSLSDEQVGCMLPFVKVEISCLSMNYPTQVCEMHSLIADVFPQEDSDTKVAMPTVVPTRTMLEKMFLLCEEFQKVKPRTLRMSRHYYDLWKLIQTPYWAEVLHDMSLYQAIVQHRATYYNVHYVDYALLQPNTISILPPEHLRSAYEQDYASMVESYIYGSAPVFDELMAAMQKLQDQIRKMKSPTL